MQAELVLVSVARANPRVWRESGIAISSFVDCFDTLFNTVFEGRGRTIYVDGEEEDHDDRLQAMSGSASRMTGGGISKYLIYRSPRYRSFRPEIDCGSLPPMLCPPYNQSVDWAERRRGVRARRARQSSAWNGREQNGAEQHGSEQHGAEQHGAGQHGAGQSRAQQMTAVESSERCGAASLFVDCTPCSPHSARTARAGALCICTGMDIGTGSDTGVDVGHGMAQM